LEKIWLVGTAFSNSTDGEGTLMKTMNSGSTWEKQLQMLGSSFHCVNVTSSGMAWVAGGEGLILFTNDIIDNIVDNFEKSGELAEVGQNYPNPLSINYDKQTRIQFALKSSENICITVCDILGRVIKILMSQSMNSGIYEITWDGKNEEGIFVSSGVYFYVVRSKTFVIKKKMLVIH
jgi:hypothetical protein